jgi:serine/threonine-protein kinase HipA
MNGERVGTWTVRPKGDNEFAYAESWLHSESVRPVSLSLPLRPASQPYHGDVVLAYFDNLLPDAKVIREHMKRRLKAASTRPFDLLVEAGRDCVGAVQLLPPGEEPKGYNKIEGVPLTPRRIEMHLGHLKGGPLGQLDEDEFRISLAGAQEKTALLFHQGKWMQPKGATPTTHILKLPIGVAPRGIDLTTSVENEWLCGRILDAYGIPVAKTEIKHFGAEKALVVERFDRRPSEDKSWIIRLPQEDFCQATGTPPSNKYENEGGPGIKTILDLLNGSARPKDDRANFLRTQILFWMLCAIDGHAKNFSIYLEQGGGYRLTPLYDVLSAYPVLGKKANQLSPNKVKLAMAVEGKSRHYHWNGILRRHWNETARICGYARNAEKIIEELIERTPGAVERVRGALPRTFPLHVAETVLTGLERATQSLARQPS